VTAENAVKIRKGVAIVEFNYIHCLFAHAINLVFEKASERVPRLELLREKISRVVTFTRHFFHLHPCGKKIKPTTLNLLKEHTLKVFKQIMSFI